MNTIENATSQVNEANVAKSMETKADQNADRILPARSKSVGGIDQTDQLGSRQRFFDELASLQASAIQFQSNLSKKLAENDMNKLVETTENVDTEDRKSTNAYISSEIIRRYQEF